MDKKRRKILLEKGNKNNHSHLIIVIDKSEFILDEIIRYVKRDEDIKNILFNYICNPNFEIYHIYNYDMDLEKQLNENKPYHIFAPYNKIDEAYIFAKEKHEGQIRKDGIPYITHPIIVAEIVKKYFFNHPKLNELITAAYLHDTIEDTNATMDEITQKFGEYVAYLVQGVTNNNKMKNIMGKTNYLCNKMLNMDEIVLNLKLCDRLANILDLKNAPNDFKEKYIIETTIIINYLFSNRNLTEKQKEIIEFINNQINDLRKQKILRLIKTN